MTLEEGLAELHRQGWTVVLTPRKYLFLRSGAGTSEREYRRRVGAKESWAEALAKAALWVETEES